MSEQDKNQAAVKDAPEKAKKQPAAYAAESQQERWLKYGMNVGLTALLAIVIAALAVWATGRMLNPTDTTAAGVHSLRPQTVNVLQGLKQKVELISIYAPVKEKRGTETTNRPQVVRDLLEEYARRSNGKITVQAIDKVADADKVEQLIEKVKANYGGQETAYRDYLTKDFPKAFDEIKAFVDGELPKLAERLEKVNDPTTMLNLAVLQSILSDIPDHLGAAKKRITQTMAETLPNYKEATDDIKRSMNQINTNFGDLVEAFNANKGNPKIPADLRQYMVASVEGYGKTKKIAEEQVQKMDKLGSVEKLDELRRSLRTEEVRERDREGKPQDAVLVMGEKEMRVVWASQLWQEPDKRQITTDGGNKPRFAGEQQITGAILAATAPKTKVAIIRPGGPPLTAAAVPGMRGSGPLSAIGDRLRQSNFEILEKDAQRWGPQNPMQQPPQGPDPTDEEMKDAVWVVLNIGPMMGMAVKDRLDAHLKAGGSAMVLYGPESDAFESVLSGYGLEAKTKAIICHAQMDLPEGREVDFWEQLYRRNPVFHVTDKYGDHALARPIQTLELGLYDAIPILQKGGKATMLVPLPQRPTSWGETSQEQLESGEVRYNDKTDDIAWPLYAGAAVEGEKGSRLAVYGSVYMVINDFLAATDRSRGPSVARFPGNAELFMNTLFWLTKNETMIAISPAAMEVSRIRPISRGMQRFWQIFLAAGLPLLVIGAGLVVYMRRRD